MKDESDSEHALSICITGVPPVLVPRILKMTLSCQSQRRAHGRDACDTTGPIISQFANRETSQRDKMGRMFARWQDESYIR